jgi:hypothetical protein
MAKSRYPSFPSCCQAVLAQLEKENRQGARNCEKGHFVSVEFAQQAEAEAARKAALAAANAPKA